MPSELTAAVRNFPRRESDGGAKGVSWLLATERSERANTMPTTHMKPRAAIDTTFFIGLSKQTRTTRQTNDVIIDTTIFTYGSTKCHETFERKTKQHFIRRKCQCDNCLALSDLNPPVDFNRFVGFSTNATWQLSS